MADLSNKVALVTGAASGIGEATALLFAQKGATLVLTDLQEDAGKKLAGRIGEEGGTAVFLPQDVCDEGRWEEVVAAAVQRFGGLHVLVNNAGIGEGASILETSLEDFRRTMSVNLEGVFLGCRAVIPAIEAAGGGSIINISSVAGLRGAPNLGAYCASKGAVRLLTKSVALECARDARKVRCNSVHPGIIETPIWDTVGDALNPGEAPPALQMMMSGEGGEGDNAEIQITPQLVAMMSVPGGQVGQPREVAEVIAFLASDASSYVNGSELVVDSAMTAS